MDLQRYEDISREQLKIILAKLPANQQLIFKRSFSYDNQTQDINSIVDNIDVDKLDLAFMQVERILIQHRVK